MRKTLSIIGAIALILAVGFIAGIKAQSSFVGALITVNNTTSNLVSGTLSSFLIPASTSTIQHGGLANTNDEAYAWTFAIDSTNYLTVFNWHPTVTNATTETVTRPATTVTIVGRVVLVTTSSVTAGGLILP